LKILDRYGNEFPNKPETQELAVLSIRDRYSSYPSQGLTPARLATIFKEADQGDVYRQMELFEEMEEKDTHLYSVLQTRKLAIQGLDWDVMPYSDDPEDKKRADFVTDVLTNLECFEDVLLDLLDAIGKGYSAAEVMWEIAKGQAWIKDIEWKQPKKFTFDDYWHLRLLTDAEPVNGIELPPGKFVVHQYKAKSGHPSRAGVIRVCGWMYLFKNYDIKDWVSFAEVFGKPIRLGKYPAGATNDDKEVLRQALIQLGTDAAGLIPEGALIEFIETKGTTGTNIYNALADFCNREMSKAVLGQTLTSEVGNTGSYAASKTHNEVRQDLKEADCKAIAKTLRRDLIKPLVAFNFKNFAAEDPQRLPWIKFHYEEPEDQEKQAKTYQVLTDMGLPIATEHIYEKFGIPKPDKGQEILKPVAISPAVAAPLSLTALKADAPAAGSVGQPAVDALADRTLEQGVAAIGALAEPFQKIINEAQSLEEIKTKLLATYQGLDATEFEELVAKAIFLADLYGRWSEQHDHA
jgi:phage gp29-like protein